MYSKKEKNKEPADKSNHPLGIKWIKMELPLLIIGRKTFTMLFFLAEWFSLGLYRISSFFLHPVSGRPCFLVALWEKKFKIIKYLWNNTKQKNVKTFLSTFLPTVRQFYR